MKGVDVSHWNQKEDIFKHICPEFIIAKLTEGKSMTDWTCFDYHTIARSIGRPFGVYHFAHPEKNSAKKEAEHFIQQYVKLNHMVWAALDVEGDALTVKNLDEWCYEWLKEVEKILYFKPWIYMSQSSCKKFNKCTEYPLWVARYRMESLGYGDITPWKQAIMWQYDSNGVDKNIFYKEVKYEKKEHQT